MFVQVLVIGDWKKKNLVDIIAIFLDFGNPYPTLWKVSKVKQKKIEENLVIPPLKMLKLKLKNSSKRLV